MADLAKDTAVKPLGGGRYEAVLPDHWNYKLPSGGVIMTVILRAMEKELARPEFPLLSATTLFCTPVPDGVVTMQVEILRLGNIAAQVRGTLTVPGATSPAAHVLATYGGSRVGPEHTGARCPNVPDPSGGLDCSEPHENNPHTKLKFLKNYEARLVEGVPWWKGPIVAGETRVSRWFRHKVPQKRPDGTLDPLVLPPLADTMPTALVQGMGGRPRFLAPSLDLTVHWIADTRSEWLLVSAHILRAHRGYGSARVELWDEARQLIGFGNQTMLFRNAPPRPEPE